MLTVPAEFSISMEPEYSESVIFSKAVIRKPFTVGTTVHQSGEDLTEALVGFTNSIFFVKFSSASNSILFVENLGASSKGA